MDLDTLPQNDSLLRRTLRRRWVPILTQSMILSVALMTTACVQWSKGMIRGQIMALETDQADLKSQSDFLDRKLVDLEKRRDEAKRLDYDEVQITLVKESRASLIHMQDEIDLKLKPLKSDPLSESIRAIKSTVLSGRPIGDRGWWLILAAIPFATFALIFGLFAGIEHRATGRDEAS